MGEQRDSGVEPLVTDVDVVHGCHQIVSAVNILVVNLEFASERVEGEVKAAIDDARAALDRIVEIARAIQRVHNGRSQVAKTGG
jgi:hypothetical protein